jgi:hypothetical protein
MRFWLSEPWVMGAGLGVSVDARDLVCQRGQRKTPMQAFVSGFISIAFPILIAVLAVIFIGIIKASACEVAVSDYKQLEMNMTYNEVTAVLQCRGEEISSTQYGPLQIKTYMWRGPGAYQLTAKFQNDEMVSKSQSGL